MQSGTTLASRREWIGLGVIMLPCLLYSMDLTVLNLALPAIGRALRPSSAEQLWIVDIYGFLLAGSLIPMGALGDRIGRRKLLLIGAGAFGAVSVLAAFSTSASMLIATRALLGVAGATLAPSTLSLIRNMFSVPEERTLAIGIWATSYAVGAALGPLLGGLLLARFWWGSAFLIGVPIMLLLLVLGPLLLPEFRDPEARSVDLPSALMSLSCVLSVIYAIKRTTLYGVGVAPALVLSFGLAVGVAFVRRQRTLENPLIDLALFRVRGFGAALVSYTLSIFAIFGCFLAIAQYLQLVLALSPMSAGLWTLPSSGALILGSLLAPLAVRRMSTEAALMWGFSLAGIGCVVLASATPSSSVWWVVTASVLVALGIAPVGALSTDRVVGLAPVERAGAAAALSETGAEFGGALGIAVLGSVIGAVYRARMSAVAPVGLSDVALTTLRETLSGAVAVAADLPGALGVALLERARRAFTDGMFWAALFSAALLVGLVLLSARTRSKTT